MRFRPIGLGAIARPTERLPRELTETSSGFAPLLFERLLEIQRGLQERVFSPPGAILR